MLPLGFVGSGCGDVMESLDDDRLDKAALIAELLITTASVFEAAAWEEAQLEGAGSGRLCGRGMAELHKLITVE